MSAFAPNALAALRARFSPAALRTIAPLPYPDVLRAARERRALALVESRWQETKESAQETPVIRSLHAFIVEQEPAGPIFTWNGCAS